MVNWCVTSKKFLFLCQSFSLAMLPFSSGSLDVKEDKIDALLGCKSQQQPTVASRPRNCILRVVRMLSKRAGKSPNKRISFSHIFKNYSKCRIWILAFSINFCPFKSDLFGNTIWLLSSGFPNLAGMDHFCHFRLSFVHSKCRRSSLRSQCWKRHFSVIFKQTPLTLNLMFSKISCSCRSRLRYESL